MQKKTIIRFITHILSLIAFRNKFHSRMISTDNSITHFFGSYSNQGQILMNECDYQQLYHLFVDFCSSQEETLTFHYFIE